MDTVSTVRECLEKWSAEGEAQCRAMLTSPHCNLSDTNCVDVLTTVYHTLLAATLKTWALLSDSKLSPQTLVDFMDSVLSTLPSSSKASSSVNTFGEHLVDMLWALDVELDEVVSEAKASISNFQTRPPSPTVAALISKATKAQMDAESDLLVLRDIVKRLLERNIIHKSMCRERLGLATLAGVGLIADATLQEKKEVRTRTGLFYKQNKFNLLREQSEGYSKLTVELTAGLGLPHSAHTGRPQEPWSAIIDRARPVWEKVISLIGYFDLDPNRALDIILDVLSVHLTTHYTFFIALLSFSPWCGSYRRPDAEDSAMDADTPQMSRGKTLNEILSALDSKTHKTLNQTRVLAQVLGFKLTHYAASETAEGAPRSLYLTAALLIREGFITLEDLYPHLVPRDEDMESVRAAYLADVDSRIEGAKISQLAMAAPLESGSSSNKPKSPPAEQKKPEVKQPPNQKIGLLVALLSVGSLRPAIALLSKFPWLVDARPEIADLMIRVLKVSISCLYESTINERNPKPVFTHPRTRYGAVNGSKKSVLTLWAPTPPGTASTDFVFFFPDWVERVPLCAALDDLVDVFEPMMRFIGLHISRDPVLLTKFVRLGRVHLQSTVVLDPETKKPTGAVDAEHPIRLFWFKMLRLYLLPALPLIRGNAVCTVEIWNIIRLYETTWRWRLYGEWKSSTYKTHTELRVRAVQADRESKGILRRLSHNTIDSLAGTVAKLAHSNPCIFFANAVSQIMAYDNLASVVIQALRYVTNMGFDVLVFVILDALADPNKQRVKSDGVNISDWLQSLASFTGMLFRRYSADLTPVLKYVVHQLRNEQATEIVVLRELIWKMAGIEPLPSLSESQIQAMAGGPILRIESVASQTRGAALDPGDAILKGPQRLGKVLLDSGLALPLLIQVAHQRLSCVHKNPNAPLKSLAGLFDMTHGVLLQYLELLTSPPVISAQDYATKVLPSFAELGEVYHIDAPIFMQIIRPVLQTALLAAATSKQRLNSEEAEKRLKATLTAQRESASRVASPANPATPVMEDQSRTDDVNMDPDHAPSAAPVPESPWVPELEAIFGDVKQIAPKSAMDVIGPGYYLTFWQLSTYDLTPPFSNYNETSSSLRQYSRTEDTKYIAADRSVDRSKRMTAVLHRAKRDRYNLYIDLLNNELKDQTTSREYTIKRLAKEKNHWFSQSPKSTPLVNAIIEHCIQPRCLLSPMDADFCAQFIKVMHTQGTPGFHTLLCYDRLLGDHVKVVIFSCSEYEARNYGRFLLGILGDLLKWHNDEQTYNLDNRTKVAGKTVFHPGFQRAWKNKGGAPESWNSYQQILRKWHRKLTRCFTECISTGEFMHVYNAIVVLKEILPVFPLAAVCDGGSSIDRAIDDFLEKEQRGDLKILGKAYSASLKKREPLWTVGKPPTKPNGASPKPATPPTNPAAEKGRPTGPASNTATAANGSRSAPLPTSAPSAPRAQLSNPAPSGSEKPSTPQPSTAKFSDSIPRPEVVRRVRPDTKNSESPKPPGDTPTAPHSDITKPIANATHQDANIPNRPAASRYNSPANAPEGLRPPPSLPQNPMLAVRAVDKDLPNSPRGHRPPDDRIQRTDSNPNMPPPSVPSQTASAQELRETAKQSVSRPEKSDERGRGQNGSAAPSPRHRSPSPSSRPGTRNPSSDSRASGDRSRPERSHVDGAEDRRDKDGGSTSSISRQDSREHSKRDSLSHRSKSGRDRGRDGDKDKDGERDRERDRGRRDRERDRDHRDRDRDRDRHRRDDKDRDRDSRKDRESASRTSTQGGSVPTAQEDRGLPTRPDPARHRAGPSGDDALGKRRRPTDDDPDRGSKRSSRKERDDRNRRPAEKDVHDRVRDSDRRKEHDAGDDARSAADKCADKRPQDALPTTKTLPSSTPSAPRAMAATDPARTKSDLTVGRDRHRDYQSTSQTTSTTNAPSMSLAPADPSSNVNGSSGAVAGSSSNAPSGASLRSRISDKEPPRLPQSPANLYRSEPPRKEDDRDSRKRTLSERERELNDNPPASGSEQASSSSQPPKRPRINRNRYPSNQNTHGLIKKFLPDSSSGDKGRARKD